jgi:hypothetical protein
MVLTQISAGSMGGIPMLEPVAAPEPHAPVVAVPVGVARARNVQCFVEYRVLGTQVAAARPPYPGDLEARSTEPF